MKNLISIVSLFLLCFNTLFGQRNLNFEQSLSEQIPYQITCENEGVQDFVWSPDGSQFAYIALHNDTTRLYRIDLDGSNKTELCSNAFGQIDWKDTVIVFRAIQPGAPSPNNILLKKINPDGSGISTIIGPYWYSGVYLRADANWILYRRAPSGWWVAMRCDIDGNNVLEVSHNDLVQQVGWLGTNQILYTRGPDYYTSCGIHKVNFDGSGHIQLTPENLPNNSTFIASPDTTKILYCDGSGNNWDIWIMDADGNNKTQLTLDPARDYISNTRDDIWSEDGQSFYFVSDRSGNGDIYRLNVDGSNLVQMTSHDSLDYMPIPSPDGSKLAFLSKRDGVNNIWVIDLLLPIFIQQGPKLVGIGYIGQPQQGWSVDVSGDGNTAVVGAPTDDGSGGFGVGAAWIFVRQSDGVWSQQGAKLVGDGAVGTANQGQSVSISNDGNTVAIAGPGDDNSIGATWIFSRNVNGIWNQQGSKLVGTGYIGPPRQGSSVSINGDGSTMVVGGFNDNGALGAAWIFIRDINGNWIQQGTKLVGTGYIDLPQQGCAVSISADGNTAAIGGLSDNNYIGAVWVFTRNINGVWNQQGAKLVGTGHSGMSYQGWSVAVSGDGNTILSGGNNDNNSIGAAWIFNRDINEVWTQQGSKLVGSGYFGQPEQGYSVSLNGNGNIAVVGGMYDDDLIGAAWIFTRDNSGVWDQLGSKLVGDGTQGNSTQGCAVSISDNGNTLIVGGRIDNSWLGATWIYFSAIIPVEFTSFTAEVNKNTVNLNWTTDTELNNQGFEIERASSSTTPIQEVWEKVGFVPGSGTTTEPRSYSFVDRDLEAGNYFYRLKQIDYDGSFEYSQEVEVEIASLPPVEYALKQNYPNPFNPATIIKYNLPSKNLVTLKVFNLLGEEITTLVNELKEAGSYEVNFSAGDLPSGIYLYRLSAGEYVSTKKMILLK